MIPAIVVVIQINPPGNHDARDVSRRICGASIVPTLAILPHNPIPPDRTTKWNEKNRHWFGDPRENIPVGKSSPV